MMNDKKQVGTVNMDRSLKGLNNRRALAKMCIHTLDHMTDEELIKHGSTNEKRKAAMEVYKKQLASIDAQITEITGTL